MIALHTILLTQAVLWLMLGAVLAMVAVTLSLPGRMHHPATRRTARRYWRKEENR